MKARFFSALSSMILVSFSMSHAQINPNPALNIPVTRIFQHGTIVSFGTSYPVDYTCNYWGTKFRFDSSTPEGKGFLTLLLNAKTTGKTVDVWYNATPTPNAVNGACTPASIWGIGLTD